MPSRTAFCAVVVLLAAITLSAAPNAAATATLCSTGAPHTLVQLRAGRGAVSCTSDGLLMRLRGGAEDKDDEDLFADDDEDAEADKEAMKKKAEEAKAKAKGDKPPAKTNVVLDVKGWDDETDLVEMEKLVREIEMDGLLWGASGLEEVGYGMKKLRITCVVEDDKVSIDELEEKIKELEDHVQSVDVAAMQKI